MTTPTTWSSYVFAPASGDVITDSLRYGTQWASSTITFSFPQLGSYWSTDPTYGYGPNISNGGEPWRTGFVPLYAEDAQAIRTALASWAGMSPACSGRRGRMRY